ncbi:MAG: hypothetical protein VSS75_028790 [Candidatus Parabeggiatoa sp.]|nr:hypothetical protein [Candidatus Parabeggiatoa sp.]
MVDESKEVEIRIEYPDEIGYRVVNELKQFVQQKGFTVRRVSDHYYGSHKRTQIFLNLTPPKK